jgi:putative transposase
LNLALERYRVKSQSNNGDYRVDATEIGWKCSCPDHVHRGVKCKHVHAVELSLAIRKEVEARRIEPIIDIQNCIYCKSTNIVKDGIRHNKCGDIQKFNCKNCNRYLTINIGFEKMKHNPQGVTTAMQLYLRGESLRNTQASLLGFWEFKFRTKLSITGNEFMEDFFTITVGKFYTHNLKPITVSNKTDYICV